MTSTQLYHLGLSTGLGVSIVSLIAVIFSPKTNSTQFHLSNSEHLSPMIVKVVNLFGGDLLAMLPSSLQKQSISNKEINDLFQSSGNPWGVTKLDFFALRVAYAFIGIIVAAAFGFLADTGIIFVGMFILLGGLHWNLNLSNEIIGVLG